MKNKKWHILYTSSAWGEEVYIKFIGPDEFGCTYHAYTVPTSDYKYDEIIRYYNDGYFNEFDYKRTIFIVNGNDWPNNKEEKYLLLDFIRRIKLEDI